MIICFLQVRMSGRCLRTSQYQGRSAVLQAGPYYDTSLLPFGNNDLSSAKMVGAITANMDHTRKEMSHARGIGIVFMKYPLVHRFWTILSIITK